MAQGFTSNAAIEITISNVETTFPSGHIPVDQGIPAPLVSGWPVKITDGINTLGTLANPLNVTTGQTTASSVNGAVNISGWFGATTPTIGSKTSANSIPVVIASDQAAIPVIGSFSIPQPLQVEGAITLSGNPLVTVSNFPTIQTVQGTVAVSGLVIEVGDITISGLANVAVNNWPANQQVFGSVTLSGNSNITVSNFPNIQTVEGTINLSGISNVNVVGIEQPITIQGIVSLSGNNNIVVDLPPVLQVGGMVGLSGNPLITISNTIANQQVFGSITISGNPQVQISNLPTDQTVSPLGGATFPVTGSVTLSGSPTVTIGNLPTDQTVSPLGGAIFPVTGAVTISGNPLVTVSNTLTVSIPQPLQVEGGIYISGALPTGVNNIGSVISGPQPNSTYPVTGSVTLSGSPAVTIANFPSTQTINGLITTSGVIPVYNNGGIIGISGNPLVTISNTIANQQVFGSVTISGTPSVSISNLPADQTVSPLGGAVFPVNGVVTLSGSPAVTVTFPTDQTVSPLGGATFPVTGAVTLSGNPSVNVTFPTTQNVNIVAYDNPLTINGAVSISGMIGTGTTYVAVPTSADYIAGIDPSGHLVPICVDTSGHQLVNLNDANGNAVYLGQQSMAQSLPVTFASNQSSLPITGTIITTPPPVTIVAGMVGISGDPLVQIAPLPGATFPVTGAITISGTPSVSISNFPATQNVNLVGYPNPITVNGIVTLSGSPSVTAALNLPPTLIVGGMVGISGNPLVQAGPVPDATYPVTGAVTISGNPMVTVSNALTVSIPQPLQVEGGIYISGALPAGTNNIGSVIAGPLPGATYPITGNVTLSGSPLVTIVNQIANQQVFGSVTISGNPSITVTPSTGAIFPIEGTVALSGIGTNNSPMIVAGTVTVSGGSNSELVANQQVFGSVTISGNPLVTVSNFPANQQIFGSVTLSGNPQVQISNLPIDQTVSPLGGATFPVTGSVTISGTPATNWAQINGIAVDTNNGPATAGTERVTIATNSAALSIQGIQPSGTFISGYPILIGGRSSINASGAPSAQTDGQLIDFMVTRTGKQIVQSFGGRESIQSNTVTLGSATETTIMPSGAAGNIYNDLVSLSITNSSATPTVVSIRDTTGGTVRLSYAIAAYGGVSQNFTTPWPQTTASRNWTATLSPTATSVYINIQTVETY